MRIKDISFNIVAFHKTNFYHINKFSFRAVYRLESPLQHVREPESYEECTLKIIEIKYALFPQHPKLFRQFLFRVVYRQILKPKS